MICKNCKHWFVEDPKQIIIAGRGICLKTTSVKSDDNNDRMAHHDDDSNAFAISTVISTFGYRMVISQLETTEDFGCNQYEAK